MEFESEVKKALAVSIQEAASQLNVSSKTIRRLIDAGELRAFRVLRQWRIRNAELKEFIQRQEGVA